MGRIAAANFRNRESRFATLETGVRNQLTMYLPDGSSIARDMNPSPAPSVVNYLNLAMR